MSTGELHLLVCVLVVGLAATSASAGRCYLCSQDTLRECVGNHQADSSLYTTVLQYYTEPCNGQCVLFRNHNGSIERGCSWTYGHMKPKSIGWHEISPRVQAYFCDSHLCNNGTIDQADLEDRKFGMTDNPIVLSPHELFLLAGRDPTSMRTGLEFSRQLRHCYSCTARYDGCGEFMDPHYAAGYIQPCTSSCVIFRNPNDLNLITRDCSTLWPQVPVPNGYQKLLGSDAFFCQESLCNGISFDFIMGVLYNRLPTVITFAPIPTHDNISIPTTATTTTQTTLDVYNDSVIWDDPDLDYGLVESATSLPSENSIDQSSSPDDFDFIGDILANSTLITGYAVYESNSSLDMWNSSEPLLPIEGEDNSWELFNTTLELPVSRFDHLSNDDDDDDFSFNSESDAGTNMTANDAYAASVLNSTTMIDLLENQTHSIFPDPMQDGAIADQLLEYIQPFPSFAMPPFSWILNMINHNKSEVVSSTTVTTTTTTTSKPNIQTTTATPPHTSTAFFEYCQNKRCQHGGRLNSDCLCICLPAYTGDACETVLCEQEPVHTCAFVLEHECEMDHVRYLCPNFCRLQNCLPEQA